jgi:NAD(P)-dependent dehydrogenase (short-subunit alcohol dehydrogenase family)
MKTAFVTGAGQGLGKAFVKVLQENGYYVFAGVKKEDQKRKKTLSQEYIVCDVADDESIKEAVKYIASKTTSLDLIVNNAAVNKDTATDKHKELVNNLEHLSREHLLKMFNINAIAPLMVAKYFLKLLKGEPSFIVNISSCRASYHDEFADSNPNYGYKASKAALNMFVYSMVSELPKNVKTFAVHPGDMKTPMNKDGVQSPRLQAKRIIGIINDWKEDKNGHFLRWSGERYPL